MKKAVMRALGIVLAIVLVLSLTDMTAYALTINDSGAVELIDVEWQSPTEIVSLETQEKQFIVSTKTEKGRVKNLFFQFPTEGGVRFHADQTGFWNAEEYADIDYTSEGAAIVMSANGTTVKFYEEASPWRFEVYNDEGKMVVWYLSDQMFFGYDDNGELRKVKIVSDVSKSENLFGLGERFGGFLQNGKTVEMWNFDSFGQLRRSYGDHNVGYVNVPLLHSSRGYSVFHNNNYYGIIDVADTEKDKCSAEFYGPMLDMYLWTGTTLENLDSYCKLTGSSATVPKYALSYIPGQATTQWTANGKGADEVFNTVKSHLDKYEELNTPIKLIHLESVGNDARYSKLHDYLNSKGIKFMGWTNSAFIYIDSDAGNPSSNSWNFAKKLGWATADIPIVKWNHARFSNFYDDKGAGMQYVDYSDPKAVQWSKKIVEQYVDKGLIGIMIDYNDIIPGNAYYPGVGKDGNEMHNLSQYYYAKSFYEAMDSYYGEGQFMNTVRAGVAGTQSFGPLIAGDNASNFLGIQESLSALLSSAATGYATWATDIGGLGHIEDPDKNNPGLYARWLQLGTFTPIMRAHGQTSMRCPWAYSEASVGIFQKYYWTRESLVDLINSEMIKASVENYPMTQAMIIAYPEQADLAKNESQYLFCDSLLVAPVTTQGASSVKIQFPKGRWVSLWDGSVIEGNTEQTVSATLDTIPVYLEAGSAFPVTLGEELKIDGVNTLGKNVNALMVAPAVEKKVNTFYADKEEKYVYTSDILAEGSYSLAADKVSDKRIVVVKGLVSDNVKEDGVELKELKKRPTSQTTEQGFYCDAENNTTIIVTDGSWSRLEYAGQVDGYANIALHAPVTATQATEKQTENLQAVTDGDFATQLTLYDKKETEVTVDLKDSYHLNRILVKWGSEYAKEYKVEVSDSAEEDAKWVTVMEMKDGGGGTDVIPLEGIDNCRYIRISQIGTKAKTGAKLVEIEAYGDLRISEVDASANIGIDKDADGNTSDKPQGESKLDYSVLWIGLGTAAVILAIGGVCVVLILKKKKQTEKKIEGGK